MSIPHTDLSSARLTVIDADGHRRAELCAMLRDAGYSDLAESADPRAVSFDEHTPDLALLDLDDTLHSDVEPLFAERWVPVLGVTSDASAAGRRRAASAGVTDFIMRPIEYAELRMRMDNALANARLRRLVSDGGDTHRADSHDGSEAGTVRESLSLLAAVADFHDDDTDQHAHRVGVLSGAIARALELPDEFAEMLRQAAPLHDIGKVGISRRILLKPDKLTPPEWLHMMQHVDIGGQILASAQSSVLHLAGEIARTHHERWDGSGYTAGLAGQEIPISGRIVAVADVWDTLTHDRPYREAWQHERALAEIRSQAGAQFDPAVVDAFCRLDLGLLAQRPAGDRLAA